MSHLLADIDDPTKEAKKEIVYYYLQKYGDEFGVRAYLGRASGLSRFEMNRLPRLINEVII
jgi:hypothetical protein